MLSSYYESFFNLTDNKNDEKYMLQIKSSANCWYIVWGRGTPQSITICQIKQTACQLQLLLYQVAALISDVAPWAEGVGAGMLTASIVPAATKQELEHHLVVPTRKSKAPVDGGTRKVTCCQVGERLLNRSLYHTTLWLTWHVKAALYNFKTT